MTDIGTLLGALFSYNSIHQLRIPNKYHTHEIQTDSRRFERDSLTQKLTQYSLDRYGQEVSCPHDFLIARAFI